jgi:drug/metabolite transporter (DMT)-like permease
MDAIVNYGPLGFWMFLAACVVSGMWFDARKRESQQETLRRLVESGKDIDSALIDKLVSSGNKDDRADDGLKTAGLIVIFAAPGMIALGYFMSRFNDKIWDVMLGVSVLVGFVGLGLLVAGFVSERRYNDNKG